MTAQLAGILLGVFSVIASAVIYWGGFAEEKRANALDAERIAKL